LTDWNDLEYIAIFKVSITARTRKNENYLRHVFSEIYNQREIKKGKKIR
jgi:hypothetical protein